MKAVHIRIRKRRFEAKGYSAPRDYRPPNSSHPAIDVVVPFPVDAIVISTEDNEINNTRRALSKCVVIKSLDN